MNLDQFICLSGRNKKEASRIHRLCKDEPATNMCCLHTDMVHVIQVNFKTLIFHLSNHLHVHRKYIFSPIRDQQMCINIPARFKLIEQIRKRPQRIFKILQGPE